MGVVVRSAGGFQRACVGEADSVGEGVADSDAGVDDEAGDELAVPDPPEAQPARDTAPATSATATTLVRAMVLLSEDGWGFTHRTFRVVGSEIAVTPRVVPPVVNTLKRR